MERPEGRRTAGERPGGGLPEGDRRGGRGFTGRGVRAGGRLPPVERLFPLDGGGGFGRNIVGDPADVLDGVGDEGGDFQEVFHGEGVHVGGHAVFADDGPEGEDPAVLTDIPGNADAS